MTPLDWLASLEGSGIRPGLDRMRALLRALGRPQNACPSIIVAGTNGKGSTSATLASILHAAGYRTGLYTSPHLVELRERWTIDGAMIEPAALDEAIDVLQAAAERAGITPTYFEALTLLAFIAFARAKCEVVVLEVGMGGRLDATNVVRPLAAVITPIGFDHMEYLGNTIRKIAAEKAGVIHRGAIVLTTNDDPEVLDVIERRARTFGSPVVHVTTTHDTPLAGDFQRRNAALAVAAARALVKQLPRIDEDTIERGVAATRWRGRLERLRVQDKDIWIDGGHNAHAVAAIKSFLERIPRPRLLVFGIMSDKNVHDVVAALFPLFDRVIATEPYPPRSMRADALAELGGANVTAIAEPENAFAAALEGPEPSMVVAGSLYLAGAAIAFFDKIAQP